MLIPIPAPNAGSTLTPNSPTRLAALRTNALRVTPLSYAHFVRMATLDPSTAMEVDHLADCNPRARPGDVFTLAAVPNREAALDITVVSPEARHSGQDCVAAAYAGKLRRYAALRREWGDLGPTLVPMVWSSEGRAHPTTQQVMNYVSKTLARRCNAEPAAVLKRWEAEISVILARRRARMALKLLPPLTPEEEQAYLGLPIAND